MPNEIADRIVHVRCAGRTPCALPLSEFLLELARDGAEPALIESVAHAVAWHGFYCGRHRGRTIAVFQPVGDEKAPGHLLILVRDGAVSGMLADAPLETTVIDYDSARAQVGLELPEHVGTDEFQRIRTAVMNEFLADEAEGVAPAAAAAAPTWH